MSRSFHWAPALIITLAMALTGCASSGNEASVESGSEGVPNSVYLCNTVTGKSLQTDPDQVTTKLDANSNLSRDDSVCIRKQQQQDAEVRAVENRAFDKEFSRLARAIDAADTRADKMLAVLDRACRGTYLVGDGWPKSRDTWPNEYLSSYSKLYDKYWYASIDAAFQYDLVTAMLKLCPGQFIDGDEYMSAG